MFYVLFYFAMPLKDVFISFLGFYVAKKMYFCKILKIK